MNEALKQTQDTSSMEKKTVEVLNDVVKILADREPSLQVKTNTETL